VTYKCKFRNFGQQKVADVSFFLKSFSLVVFFLDETFLHTTKKIRKREQQKIQRFFSWLTLTSILLEIQCNAIPMQYIDCVRKYVTSMKFS